VVCYCSAVFQYLFIDVEKPAAPTEENVKCFMALIILIPLLAISLLTNIVLSACLLHIKGNSSCTKGDYKDSVHMYYDLCPLFVTVNRI